jgi:hypothetical protein
MSTRLKFFGAVAGLALASTSYAQLANAQVTSLNFAAPLTQEWVRCHGTPTVPMTADAAQALPMQITGELKCGSQVSVLSDAEGYTVNVRTADGQTGYVAHNFLTVVAAPAAPKPLASAAVENNVARWNLAAAGSDQFYSDDSLVESLTVNGVTVQVSLQDTGWKLRANIAVANDSRAQVSIAPAHFLLHEMSPVARTLPYQDPKEMAQSVSHGVLRTNTSATAPASTTPQHAPASANAVDVNYKTPFTSTQTPNYLVPAQSAELAAARNDVALSAVRQIHNTALREGAVAPGTDASGAVWFERDKKAQQLVLQVPVGQTIFEFPLSFSHAN